MRVLVACEYSGTVRDAFIRGGHEAMSCDLLPTDVPGPHYQGDVRDLLEDDWDLMIAHPPCTFLTNSGERWLKGNIVRQQARKESVSFVELLWKSRIKKVAIENPVGHLSSAFMKPHQIIQPFHFGHPEWKTTCLWLRNLPPLFATDFIVPEEKLCGGNKPGRVSSRLHRLPPGPDRWKERSKTYQGIADAMASQWGAQ